MESRNTDLGITKCGKIEFRWGTRTFIMGVVNVTPDSFSGDGLGNDVDAAVNQAKRMVAEGADIIDVGGESTRPGSAANPFLKSPDEPFDAKPLSEEEELSRVIPVIKRLAAELQVPISIDTYKSNVAREAVAAGASMLNDIWGLKFDPAIAQVAAEHDLPLILMHNQASTRYNDLIPDVIASLAGSLKTAQDAGVSRDNLIIDPGIGFGKTIEQNLEILDGLNHLKTLGRPLLLGTSRKALIGRILDLPPDQRLEGTAASVALGIANGADMIRVHDVAEMVRAAKVADAIVRSWSRS